MQKLTFRCQCRAKELFASMLPFRHKAECYSFGKTQGQPEKNLHHTLGILWHGTICQEHRVRSQKRARETNQIGSMISIHLNLPPLAGIASLRTFARVGNDVGVLVDCPYDKRHQTSAKSSRASDIRRVANATLHGRAIARAESRTSTVPREHHQ